MTMHMLPIYYNTTNNKKRKKRKLTQKEISARLQHEKFLQKMGVKKPTVDYRHEFPDLTDDRPTIPTSDRICGFSSKKENNKYTGTKIIGIATMHKSNIVPISNKKDAEDVSKMRRN